VRQAFRRPGFARLYAGLTTSAFGDMVMLLVLSMWVKTITGSNAQAGLTFFFMCIPALFAPLLGVWIDRVRRRPLLIWGHVASGIGVLPLVFVRGQGQVWVIWAVAFVYGASFVVLPAALNGLLKELMPDDLLVEANSSLRTTQESFRLVGPLLGALLFTFLGGWAVAVLDAATFFAAAAVIWTVAVSEAAPVHESTHFRAQVTAGLRHLYEDRVLEHTLIGYGLFILVIGFSESAIYALLDAFDKPATWVSVIVVAQGVGAIAGGLASSTVVRRVGEVGACAAGLVVAAAAMVTMAAAREFALVLVAAALVGTALPLLTVALMTLVQRRTPQPVMGRVSAAVELVMGAPQAISLAVGSLLVVVWGYRTILGVMGAVTLLGAVYIAVTLRRHIAAELHGRPLAGEPSVVAAGVVDP
jgi:MFS family permease